MRVVVVGAYGFIGRGITAALLSAGHEVIGAGRDVRLGRRLIPGIKWIQTDFNKDLDGALWAARFAALGGPVDAVVNAVGILQSDLRDKADNVHSAGARALFDGAEDAGIARIIHISATTLTMPAQPAKAGDETLQAGAGVAAGEAGGQIQEGAATEESPLFEKPVPTDYALSKLEGEAYLEKSGLDYVIVRPSLVIGPGSTGGAMLMRGLAGLPFVIPLPSGGGQLFQPVMLDDLAAAVVKLVEGDVAVPADRIFYAVGPEVLSLRDVVRGFRRWLGFGRSLTVPVPRFLMLPLLKLGDLAALFGNRSSLRTASLEQMNYFTAHDPAPFAQILGSSPAGLDDYLARTPADLPDRQSARTVFLWPLLKWVMGLSLIVLGVEGLYDIGAAGIGETLGAPGGVVQTMDGALSILAGGLFLSNRWMRLGGTLKIMLLLITGFVGLSYAPFGLNIISALLGIFLPILMIAVVMGLNEKR